MLLWMHVRVSTGYHGNNDVIQFERTVPIHSEVILLLKIKWRGERETEGETKGGGKGSTLITIVDIQ